MIRRRFSRQPPSSSSGLSDDFGRRLEERLTLADARKQRRAAVRRWRWTAFVLVPVASAICWAALPWTFGNGVRALVGALGYITMLLSVASSINRGYLAYLGLGAVPFLIDVLLLAGVVSWLVWASQPPRDESARAVTDQASTV